LDIETQFENFNISFQIHSLTCSEPAFGVGTVGRRGKATRGGERRAGVVRAGDEHRPAYAQALSMPQARL